MQEFLYIIYQNITYIAFTLYRRKNKVHRLCTYINTPLFTDLYNVWYIHINFTDWMNIIIHILIDINIDVDDVHVHMDI